MAATVGTLQSVLSRYIPRDDSFAAFLNQVGPRLYALGNWRDLVHDEAVVTDVPYVSLPRDYEALLAGVVDSVPVVGSSRWQDYRNIGMAGNTRGPSLYFGLVDDGLRPTLLDLADGDATGDGDYDFKIEPAAPGETLLPSTGSVFIHWVDPDDDEHVTEYALNGAANVTSAFSSGNGAVRVRQVSFLDVPKLVKITAVPVTAGTEFKIADGRHDEIAEYRRYRMDNSPQNRTVSMLLKRRWLNVKDATDVVRLSDINVIKHGLLAIIAEDASDLDAAQFHWGECVKVLETQIAHYRGAIRPRINFDPTGTGAPVAVGML
jgi:hypothetical protein